MLGLYELKLEPDPLGELVPLLLPAFAPVLEDPGCGGGFLRHYDFQIWVAPASSWRLFGRASVFTTILCD